MTVASIRKVLSVRFAREPARALLVLSQTQTRLSRGEYLLKLIQPISKKNQVVLAIKEAILSGSINPGDQIVESRIAHQLGSGIPLVREALIELEHHGFVQKTPYKGTTVTKLGPKEIRENFQLRAELEALAVEWARDNVTSADIKDLRKLITRMEQSAAELDLDEFYQSDLEFHRKLWSLSGNTYLADVLERMVVPLFAFFVMKTRRKKESYVASAAMHGEIVSALEAKSTELRELMRDSLKGWTDDMLDLLFAEPDKEIATINPDI
jgi:DNA-binding GntR family transcriptional regulator